MTNDFPVTIYHNPACGTSRGALAAIREAGIEPVVVDYVKAGWTRAVLTDLLRQMDARPRDLMRVRGTPAADLGLTDEAATDEAILAAMVEHPILVERPIVITPKGAALCRPVERVQALL